MLTYQQRIEEMNYWSDSRTIESLVTDDNFFIPNSKTQINMIWVQDKWEDWAFYEELECTFEEWVKALGGSATVQCETKFVLCPTCQGRGTHTNPNIDCGGITASEWYEWGPEEQDHYMSGAYDVSCYQCNGEKVIQQFEYDTKNPLYNWCCERLNEYYEAQYESAQEYAKEKRYGC